MTHSEQVGRDGLADCLRILNDATRAGGKVSHVAHTHAQTGSIPVPATSWLRRLWVSLEPARRRIVVGIRWRW